MSNSKLHKHGFCRSVSCTPVKHLSKKNWSELFKKFSDVFAMLLILVSEEIAQNMLFGGLIISHFHKVCNYTL